MKKIYSFFTLLGSSILITIIWILVIPWDIFVMLPTGYFLHEFDIVMQPYYWWDWAYNNLRYGTEKDQMRCL
jgi:hypothetical protein